MHVAPQPSARHAAATRRTLLAGLASAMLAAPLPALAHAILVDSVPAALGRVAAGRVTLRLRFNSRIDRKRSRLLLVRPDKSQATLAISESSTDNVLITEATLAAGDYTVRWQVLAVDGHITRGDLPFTVISH